MTARMVRIGIVSFATGVAVAVAMKAAYGQAAPATGPASRAIYVADLLAEADRAAGSGTRADRRMLAARIAILDRMNVRSSDAGDDAIGEWRMAAGGKAKEAYRGRLLGPAYQRGWIESGGERRIEQLFVSGQPANVSIATIPSAKMELGVTGPNSVSACTCEPRQCTWLPAFTQRYTITLRNVGPQAARFYLVVD